MCVRTHACSNCTLEQEKPGSNSFVFLANKATKHRIWAEQNLCVVFDTCRIYCLDSWLKNVYFCLVGELRSSEQHQLPVFLNEIWRDARVCIRQKCVCGGTRGGPKGGVRRPAHFASRICVTVCSAELSCRQTASRPGPTGPFLTVEVPQQPEPGGGRWEEAERPQQPHRTAFLKTARGRSRLHQAMSTVWSILIYEFVS